MLIRFVADHSVSYTHRLPRRGAGGGHQGDPKLDTRKILAYAQKDKMLEFFFWSLSVAFCQAFHFFAIFLFYGILIIFLAIPCVKASQFVYYI